MVLQQIIHEMQQIPESKQTELYDLIHRFRLRLIEKTAAPRTPGLLQGKLGDAFFEPLPEDELRIWE